MSQYTDEKHPRDPQGQWSDEAFFRNQEDIEDYKNQPRSSIWDGDDHEPYDQDEEDERQSELEKEEQERQREHRNAWFGGDLEDYDDMRWGAERTYQPDQNGMPYAQHGEGSRKLSKGYSRTKYNKPQAQARKISKSYTEKRRKYSPTLFKRRKTKQAKSWWTGKPKKTWER